MIVQKILGQVLIQYSKATSHSCLSIIKTLKSNKLFNTQRPYKFYSSNVTLMPQFAHLSNNHSKLPSVLQSVGLVSSLCE